MSADDDLAHAKVFGPVLVVIPVDSETLHHCGSVAYLLSAGAALDMVGLRSWTLRLGALARTTVQFSGQEARSFDRGDQPPRAACS